MQCKSFLSRTLAVLCFLLFTAALAAVLKGEIPVLPGLCVCAVWFGAAAKLQKESPAGITTTDKAMGLNMRSDHNITERGIFFNV